MVLVATQMSAQRNLNEQPIYFDQKCGKIDIFYIKMLDEGHKLYEVFSWMSKYARITQHMNREHFLFYLLHLCDSCNRM